CNPVAISAQPRPAGAIMRAAGHCAAAVLAGALLADPLPGQAQDTVYTQIERGRYALITGNCQGCHTVSGEEPFAGGRGLETPFGTIYTPNITFDPETGLGRWSRDDFWRAMHEGIAPDGSRLYPAFPFPPFSRMPRDEVDALYDYRP